MKLKNLIIMGAIAAVLIVVAVRSSREKNDTAMDRAGKRVLPDLPLNDVESLVIVHPHDTVTVARVADAWVVPSRYNYPADFNKIRGLLLKLAELKIGQLMTIGESQKPALKMAMPGGGKESGTLLALQGAGGKKIAALLVGIEHKRKTQGDAGFYGGYGDGCYVSPDEGKSVYLVSQTLDDAASSAKEWLDHDLVNVEPSEIAEVSVTDGHGATLRFKRPSAGGNLALEGLTDKEECDSGKLSSLESALSYLRADDVADPSLSDARLGMTNATVYTAVTKKGEIYTVRVGGTDEEAGQRYVRLAVALKPAEPPAPVPAPAGTNAAVSATNDVAAAAQAAAEERKKTEERVAELGKKFQSWTFLVESYKAVSMTPTRATLVKEKKQEETKAEAPPAAEAGAATNAAAAPAPAMR